jgi:hypothetical protein
MARELLILRSTDTVNDDPKFLALSIYLALFCEPQAITIYESQPYREMNA